MKSQNIAIIGAGPAGLTAAYFLVKAGHQVTIFEADPHYVGGISRTESYRGFLFDIGGHRFFSKSKDVEDFWTEILADNLLIRTRISRIYYNNKFFSYPLNAIEALRKLGFKESFSCILSYIRAQVYPIKNPISFEDWVTNHFGKKLYRIFFKTYTEKVWGIPCSQISADWAAQRIKGLSLGSAIKNALVKPKKNGDNSKVIKTLIDTFRYPKLGPGMMWDECAKKCKKMGAAILMNTAVTGIEKNEDGWLVTTSSSQIHRGFDHVISSAPISQLVPFIVPKISDVTLHAATQLKYRDFITVVLILKDKNSFLDNWIYIHDASVKVGRIQNFKAWSPYMVPDQSMTCYGLEYFCFEGDQMWDSSDSQLIALGKRELEQVGIANAIDILDGYVVRQKKAYPVYDHFYKEHIETVKKGLEKYTGLWLVGRNGMHKYNNQDHSMMTAMLVAKNIISGIALFDVWKVNQDAEYLEAGESGMKDEGGRAVPKKITRD